jgi:hypothetical protein
MMDSTEPKSGSHGLQVKTHVDLTYGSRISPARLEVSIDISMGFDEPEPSPGEALEVHASLALLKMALKIPS